MLCNAGRGRVRAYLGYPRAAGHALPKHNDCRTSSTNRYAPAGPSFGNARMAGPMASFASGDAWVDHPFHDGIVLLGDAASTCDPSFGQGLALTLRSARLLRDHLLETDDWIAAGHAYASAQHAAFDTIHTLEGWYRQLFLETGTTADACRARALPHIAADPTRIPDLLGMGPTRRPTRLHGNASSAKSEHGEDGRTTRRAPGDRHGLEHGQRTADGVDISWASPAESRISELKPCAL